MGNTKVYCNSKGMLEVEKSAGVQRIVKQKCDMIRDRAEDMAQFRSPLEAPAYGSWVNADDGIGHVATRRIGRDGDAAINECLAHNTLKKAAGV